MLLHVRCISGKISIRQESSENHRAHEREIITIIQLLFIIANDGREQNCDIFTFSDFQGIILLDN